MSWQDDLFRIHSLGWSAEDIDDACEALNEACDDGNFEGTPINDLTPTQVRSELAVTLDDATAAALRRIASLRCRQDRDAEDLRHALYDLDAFAYKFTGDD